MKKILTLILVFILLSGCKEQELLKGLDQIQANEVIALLQRNNIEAKKQERAKEGFVILVAPNNFPTAVDLMRVHDLPNRPRIEVASMFPSDSLISSPRAEKARLLSAIEQRLENSLLDIGGVVSSRVHINYDLDSPENEKKKKETHISSIIKYDESISASEVIINDAKLFLKNSLSDVEYDNISVILTKISPQKYASHDEHKEISDISIFIVLFLIFTLSIIVFIFLYKTKSKLK